MSLPAYPAARATAGKIHAYLVRNAAEARPPDSDARRAVDAALIEAVIDAAFWASLRREETFVPRISLAIVPVEAAGTPLLFERPLPLEPGALARLAPAVERPAIHLGVWPNGGTLTVWGTTHAVPAWCVVLEVIEPGLLVVKHRRPDDSGKFVNIAVLEGDQVKIVDERTSRMPECPGVLSALLGFDMPGSIVNGVNVRVQLALSMRAHRRGGSLLIVPGGSESWRESIVRPMPYAVLPPFTRLADFLRASGPGGEARSHEALIRAIDAIAGLTAVDGATIISDAYDLVGFGAKIHRRDGWAQVEEVLVTEPIEGNVGVAMHPTQLGGTRHLSAAQFAHDQRDALALVASQDGRFTIFAWSSLENMVRAHRIEALLL